MPGPSAPPQCRSCGRLHGSWTCGECGGTSLRSVRVGSQRTAEELGRAFPGAVVRSSGASTSAGVIAAVGPEPALVVATPGAEPRAEGGYVAAVLLDAALMTARLSLDSGEQALRTWMGAAALVRPAPEGIVLLVGDALPTVSQALVRWDPAGFAERELREREQLALPPALHHVAVDGPRDAVMALLGRAALPAAAVVLGPAPVEEPDGVRTPAEPGTLALGADGERMVRALVRAPWAVAGEVTAALRSAQAVRSARGEGRTARVRVEPADVW